MNLAFDVPVNGVSFGQVAYNILFELFSREEKPYLFIKGGVADLNAYIKNENFDKWLHEGMLRGLKEYKKDIPCVKLWHINGLLESVSAHNIGFTFHETDNLTDIETNILSNQEKVIVTSKYTQQIFKNCGVENVHYCPLGFDALHFKPLPRHDFEGIVFGLRGKLEKRKHTLKILSAWAEKYGNNWNYRLDCSIYNQFLDEETIKNLIINELKGQVPENINFLGSQQLNTEYNKCLNAVDIDLTGMSGCEGFNLPFFQSLCLGKHAVALNAHVHKDFANEDNCVLVEPIDKKLEADDGFFFRKGDLFNQGNWFDFDKDSLIEAMSSAEQRVEKNAVNQSGIELAKRFSYSQAVDTLLDIAAD